MASQPKKRSLVRPECTIRDQPDVRTTVRFRDLLDRRTSSQFMHLDDALNRVGLSLHPEEWGRTKAWEHHPFRYEERFKRFYTYLARQDEKRGWVIDRVPLTSSEPRNERKRADELYKDAASALAAAIEKGVVKAIYTSNGKQRTIPQAIWADQFAPVFYTGFVYLKERTSSGTVRSRRAVWVDSRSFAAWLHPETHTSGKKLPPKFVHAVIKMLTAHSHRTGVLYRREWLRDRMATVLKEEGFILSARQFDEVIWKDRDKVLEPSKQPKGPPTATSSQLLKEQEAAITSLIRDAYRASKQAPAALPRPSSKSRG